MTEINQTVLDWGRALVICQLVIAIIGITIAMMVKKQYYSTSRFLVACGGIGMIGLCVGGSSVMLENIGHPVTRYLFIFWASSALIDLSILASLYQGRFLGGSKEQ